MSRAIVYDGDMGSLFPKPHTWQDYVATNWYLMTRAVAGRSDYINPVCMLLLSIVGVFFIYSAQSSEGGDQWIMQIVWITLGMIVYVFISALNYKFFLQNAHYIYGGCLLLLTYVAIEAVGLDVPLAKTRYGSTRWIDFGAFSIQPAELTKVGVLLMVSSLLTRSRLGRVKDSINTLSQVVVASALPFLLIFLQPDLGSCLVFIPMILSILYVSELSREFFAGVLAFMTLGISLLSWDIYEYHHYLQENNITANENQTRNAYGSSESWLPLKDYQRNRILGFIAPGAVDPQGIGVSWNRRQALIAAGSGGFTGKGYNEGTQAKLGYLPTSVAPNDFIASVILEEKGFIGGMGVLLLFTVLFGNTLRIAQQARDRFGMFLTIGVSSILAVHVFINLGMAVGVMPITGLPLPFVSYGGSFLIVCCVLLGLVQSVYRFRKDFS